MSRNLPVPHHKHRRGDQQSEPPCEPVSDAAKRRSAQWIAELDDSVIERKCCEGCNRVATFPKHMPIHCCALCYEMVEQGADIKHTAECDATVETAP